jgi:hypothetical protein
LLFVARGLRLLTGLLLGHRCYLLPRVSEAPRESDPTNVTRGAAAEA